ncbi:MAG: nucleotide-binding protein [Burkholderiales bacterium]|nr:nucleotide-binding protein [Burkholderiales bacterium]
MPLPTVFIASSSEGQDVVRTVWRLLERALGGTVEVRPWPEAFQLTRAYIESLERLLDTADFAVMVLTPDDLVRSRKAETAAPRDNVVFELGLFFGRLGRDRCFLVKQCDLDLKLPSDLLGIEPADFSMSAGRDLETALGPACARVGQAIRDATKALPSRPKLGDDERAAQSAMRRLADRITGTWWERISLKGELSGLSLVSIELDEAHSSVRLRGTVYDPRGAHVANWRSAAATLDGKKLVYVRQCQRLDARTTAWLPGLGEVDFDDSTDAIAQGKFWESDESRPEETVIKLVQLRRNRDDDRASTMRRGTDREKAALVRELLDGW